jgi:hypothetical protein
MFMLFAVPALVASAAMLAFTLLVGGVRRTAAAAADPVMAPR